MQRTTSAQKVAGPRQKGGARRKRRNCFQEPRILIATKARSIYFIRMCSATSARIRAKRPVIGRQEAVRVFAFPHSTPVETK